MTVPLLELNSMNLCSLVITKPSVYQCEREVELTKEGVLLTLLRYPVSIYKMPRDTN